MEPPAEQSKEIPLPVAVLPPSLPQPQQEPVPAIPPPDDGGPKTVPTAVALPEPAAAPDEPPPLIADEWDPEVEEDSEIEEELEDSARRRIKIISGQLPPFSEPPSPSKTSKPSRDQRAPSICNQTHLQEKYNQTSTQEFFSLFLVSFYAEAIGPEF